MLEGGIWCTSCAVPSSLVALSFQKSAMDSKSISRFSTSRQASPSNGNLCNSNPLPAWKSWSCQSAQPYSDSLGDIVKELSLPGDNGTTSGAWGGMSNFSHFLAIGCCGAASLFPLLQSGCMMMLASAKLKQEPPSNCSGPNDGVLLIGDSGLTRTCAKTFPSLLQAALASVWLWCPWLLASTGLLIGSLTTCSGGGSISISSTRGLSGGA
mmetsp:Transcript_23936/g.43939  ORF Transcript_23936/g.43939 Transcript_23936/m.43939 type:complete len:211 (+) Transcript_23936:320-952(+)